MIAASSVLVSHAYPISLGVGAAEPLDDIIGRSLGWTAVAVFFVISGFLITRSFDQRRHVKDWLAARFLRLFPGLFVVLIVTAFLYGPVTTALPIGSYFSNSETFTYVPRNLTLAFLQNGLPGVLETNPFPVAINGSLWTLFHEVACYGGVFLAGMLGLFRTKRHAAILFAFYVVLYLVFYAPQPGTLLTPRAIALRNLSLPFAIGAAAYVWRDSIRLHWAVIPLGALALVPLRWTVVFDVTLILWIAYTVMLLAYLPAGKIRRYNDLGDYSYGIYIYAFPVQQLMVWALGPMTPLMNMALSFPLVLCCAVLSWHFIESPALRLRQRVPARGLKGAQAR